MNAEDADSNVPTALSRTRKRVCVEIYRLFIRSKAQPEARVKYNAYGRNEGGVFH